MMFIQTEITPNPATLKFLPGRPVLGRGSLYYASVEEAVSSPLAQRLFEVDGVIGVFLGNDFITITKADHEEWPALKSMILAAIMNHFLSGAAILDDPEAAEQEEDESFAEEDADIVQQIKELLELRVRPAVAQDGGDIVFRGFDKGIVYLKMRGACAGCPSSTATLKNGDRIDAQTLCSGNHGSARRCLSATAFIGFKPGGPFFAGREKRGVEQFH